jgi:hypothetical protein
MYAKGEGTWIRSLAPLGEGETEQTARASNQTQHGLATVTLTEERAAWNKRQGGPDPSVPEHFIPRNKMWEAMSQARDGDGTGPELEKVPAYLKELFSMPDGLGQITNPATLQLNKDVWNQWKEAVMSLICEIMEPSQVSTFRDAGLDIPAETFLEALKRFGLENVGIWREETKEYLAGSMEIAPPEVRAPIDVLLTDANGRTPAGAPYGSRRHVQLMVMADSFAQLFCDYASREEKAAVEGTPPGSIRLPKSSRRCTMGILTSHTIAKVGVVWATSFMNCGEIRGS